MAWRILSADGKSGENYRDYLLDTGLNRTYPSVMAILSSLYAVDLQGFLARSARAEGTPFARVLRLSDAASVLPALVWEIQAWT